MEEKKKPLKTPSFEDRRRLGDGWLAMALPRPATKEGIHEALGIVRDGIRALQSTDDLGHPRLNLRAWNLMLRLQEKERRLAKRLKRAPLGRKP